eukprot:364790-Chlamydomonas_euryale.AAC.11
MSLYRSHSIFAMLCETGRPAERGPAAGQAETGTDQTLTASRAQGHTSLQRQSKYLCTLVGHQNATKCFCATRSRATPGTCRINNAEITAPERVRPHVIRCRGRLSCKTTCRSQRRREVGGG